ncbi:11752_t:CDS:2 [Entrophospora sp. SA101]|nr:11752_t:CDS:2 [Entrophospora sp. SA101]
MNLKPHGNEKYYDEKFSDSTPQKCIFQMAQFEGIEKILGERDLNMEVIALEALNSVSIERMRIYPKKFMDAYQEA